jgi:hypothetical protein
MAFIPSDRRPSGRQAASSTPVLAVGQRVFVNTVGGRAGTVPLMDESGKVLRSSLADGLEVEVIAWRPRGAGGTRYRVQAGRDGADGWLHAGNLRTTLVPPPAAESPAPPQPTAEPRSGGRRFGQRG